MVLLKGRNNRPKYRFNFWGEGFIWGVSLCMCEVVDVPPPPPPFCPRWCLTSVELGSVMILGVSHLAEEGGQVPTDGYWEHQSHTDPEGTCSHQERAEHSLSSDWSGRTWTLFWCCLERYDIDGISLPYRSGFVRRWCLMKFLPGIGITDPLTRSNTCIIWQQVKSRNGRNSQQWRIWLALLYV